MAIIAPSRRLGPVFIYGRRCLWGLAALICPVILLANTDDSTDPNYRVGTSEVRITFFATDENHHSVDTVTTDDFAVVDSGVVIREFRSLAHASETTLDIVALVDASGSVEPRLKTSIHDVLKMASGRQVSENDNFSVISFSGLRPELLCADNCRSAMAGRRLEAVKAGGATPLFDTLVFASDFVSNRRAPGVRQVLILFSDGIDTISRVSAREALDAVVASGALLYTVDLNKNGRDPRASAFLRQIAEATGGRAFSSEGSAGEVLEAALADLRASYVVTYPLPNHLVGFHSLRIFPKHNLNLRFHCRSGYYYEKRIP